MPLTTHSGHQPKMRSFVRNKSNGASEDPEAQLPDNGTDNDTLLASLKDNGAILDNESDMGTVLSNGECNGPAATNQRETTTALSDSEIGNPAATNEPDETGAQFDGEHSSTIAMNNQVNSAVLSSNEHNGNAAVNERVMNASPSNGDSVIQTNEREKPQSFTHADLVLKSHTLLPTRGNPQRALVLIVTGLKPKSDARRQNPVQSPPDCLQRDTRRDKQWQRHPTMMMIPRAVMKKIGLKKAMRPHIKQADYLRKPFWQCMILGRGSRQKSLKLANSLGNIGRSF
ncbi:hypothetical protein F4604DRAFT_1686075 [Suillus subluteus]|nr:hypothetical protein F4604DRAFT_1686075 [Suillus subluteus]